MDRLTTLQVQPGHYRGMTPIQRRKKRHEYAQAQSGKCWHCQKPLSGEPAAHVRSLPINWGRFPGGTGFLEHAEHLHHDHRTGLTIGTVHALCNAVLWQYYGQ